MFIRYLISLAVACLLSVYYHTEIKGRAKLNDPVEVQRGQ